MSRRFLIITVTFALLIAFSGRVTAQQSTNPAITSFSSSLKSIDRRALTNRTARIPVSWTTINRPILSNLVFEQVLPDNTVTATLVFEQVTVTCFNTAFFVSDPTNQNRCCTSAQSSIQAAYQPFAGGFMLWKKNPDGLTNILVFYNSETYTSFADWDGTPYQILDATPNALLPIRGFGYIWNANSNVKNILRLSHNSRTGLYSHISIHGYLW